MEGDDAAYGRLLEALTRSLRVTIRARLVRSGFGNADLEDVVQETLLAIHLKRHTWNRHERFTPWLTAIARHKLVDVMRRAHRRRAVPMDDVEWTLAEQGEEEGSREDVRNILGRLDVRRRRILQLVSIEGHSIRDAATVLEMSEVAVRVALHRTLKALAVVHRKVRNDESLNEDQ